MDRSASKDARLEHAHRRALRAARAVTISLFALGATGCSSMVVPVEEAAVRADAQQTIVDAPVADRTEAVDAGTDAITPTDVADAGCGSPESNETYVECCDRVNWDFNLGCAAWGPFVPPEMAEG